MDRTKANAQRKESRRRNFEAFARGEVEVRHGTLTAYSEYGCRCEDCTAANRDRHRAASKRRAAIRDRTELPHGRLSTYTQWGCRCEPCKKANRDSKRLERYGITAEQVDRLRADQDDRCAICGEVPDGEDWYTSLMVDHCHDSGRVRGLLCADCNTGLGRFKDRPDVLRRAIAYLEQADAAA